MKILILNSAKEWGGNERWTASICNGLHGRGHEVYLACRSDIFNKRLVSSIPVIKLPFKHEFDLHTHKELNNIIKSKAIDLLLPTKRKEYFIAGWIGKKLNIPVVFRLGIDRNIKRFDYLQKYVFKKLSTAVIVNAGIIKSGLIRNNILDEEKIHVIYNGYDFLDEIDDNIGIEINKDRFIFASAGRLAPQKGYDILLEAVKILRQKDRDFKLYIAGTGSSEETYRNFIIRNNLTDTVILIGQISNVRGLFNRSDAVIIPSRSEGVPNTLFEAWSVKKPVITSNAAGLPEVVINNENGLLVELESTRLAYAMEYLMDNYNNLKILGENGYSTLKNDFTIDKMVSKVEELFFKMIRGSNVG